jgi:hypothetical protein
MVEYWNVGRLEEWNVGRVVAAGIKFNILFT